MVDLVEVIPVDADGEGKGLPVYKDLAAAAVAAVPEATTTVEGTVKQAAFIAQLTGGESPTEAEFNSLLTALINAGIMAAS